MLIINIHCFAHWVLSGPKVIKKENSFNYGFQTKSIGDLRFFGSQFYSNKRKVVPKILSSLITPI
ncbi:MAG TPA: hypothetical protein VN854_00475, partial [Mycoplasmatales bacterium]|nr:hypothetical protein [Mycoplasmatales bacterium]